MTELPYSYKTKLSAGLLSILFGYFGAGRFDIGHTRLGFAMLT
ncbi:NINE protein [Rhodococcus oxybenzonivorans]|nr:NINE protein [Rhodococcus oxybenzonivorans]